jgi:SnoaL-like domain
MSYPITLTSLAAREAISDALYRAITGFDHNDVSIFNSAFAGEDAIMELREDETKIIRGLSAIRTEVLGPVGPMDTTHMISNMRIEVKDGANTASLTAYALEQHCPPGKGKDPNGPKYLVGAEYFIDMVRDEEDGLWKIKKWVLEVIWHQGDPSVLAL